MNPEVLKLAQEAILSGVYKKNIDYAFINGTTGTYQWAEQMGGNAALSAWVIQNTYQRIGCQMHVSKEVTDDLLATDFGAAAQVENIPWPARCIEVYFEDPLLPTILTMKMDPFEICKVIPFLSIEHVTGTPQDPPSEYITALIQEGSTIETAQHLSLQLRPEMYAGFLETGETPSMRLGILSHALRPIDNAIMAYMLQLALKVFVFCSLPQFKPTPITRKQMNWGGKPGVKERPNRPAVKVVYLPNVKHAPDAHQPTEGREFNGRRGHMRWYHAERYINKKGQWDFIQPVADPKTGKYPERHTFKVRKP